MCQALEETWEKEKLKTKKKRTPQVTTNAARGERKEPPQRHVGDQRKDAQGTREDGTKAHSARVRVGASRKEEDDTGNVTREKNVRLEAEQ